MSFAIDVIIILIAVIIIWTTTKKGFIKSVMGFVSTIAALIAAYAYTPTLAAYIKDKYLIGRIAQGISESLKSLSLDTNTDLYNLDKLAQNLPKPLLDLLDRYNMSVDSFVNDASGISGGTQSTIDKIAEKIAEPTSAMISSVISFVLIFVAALIVLAILTALLDLIFKLPALKSANTFLGFVFSVLQAILFVSAIAIVISKFVGAMISVEPTLFNENTIKDTVICEYLLEHNIFEKIFGSFK